MRRVLLPLALVCALAVPAGAQFGWFQLNGGLIARLSSSETAATIRQDGSGAVLDLYAGTTRIFRAAANGLHTITGSVLATTAYIIGTADTSGVRLDLESGSLAVRAGDDSGYVQINSGTINSTGEGIFAGNVNSDGVFRDGGNGMRFDMGTDNRARIADNGVTNTFDITLADWGTTLSAEAVPLANDASVLIGAATAGTVHVSYPGDAAIYMARGTSNSTRLADGSATFTTTKDNAGTVNFYYDNGYYLQNKTGGSLSFRVKLAGG
jgi:hypothetical protein